MRIDRTHRPWIAATVVIFVISTTAYIPYALRSAGGPRGGTALGLAYGIIGYAFMLFAGLLGARKKVPTWRIGRAQTWMRGHLWLGLVSLPLILFHAGFAWRGPLTTILMVLLFIVIASGIFGAVLQHYLPTVMLRRVPMETIYEEIPHVRAQLRAEAEQLAASIFGPIEASEIFVSTVQPFLENPDRDDLELATAERSAGVFDGLRRVLPAPLHPAIADLENICEEERQLKRQMRLYRLLHAWLIVHAPLSIALLVLVAIHAVVALRY